MPFSFRSLTLGARPFDSTPPKPGWEFLPLINPAIWNRSRINTTNAPLSSHVSANGRTLRKSQGKENLRYAAWICGHDERHDGVVSSANFHIVVVINRNNGSSRDKLALEGASLLPLVLDAHVDLTFKAQSSTYHCGQDNIDCSGDSGQDDDDEDFLQRHYKRIAYLPPLDDATVTTLNCRGLEADCVSPQHISEFRKGLQWRMWTFSPKTSVTSSL